ncbi:MAG: outer membrane beta-barrel protein [Parafilimonas sp.]
MDDLFRKAAENYTPNAGDSGWNNIHLQLEKPVITAQPVSKKNRKKNSLLLLLLIPILIGAFSYYFIHDNVEKPATTKYIAHQNAPTKNDNEIMLNNDDASTLHKDNTSVLNKEKINISKSNTIDLKRENYNQNHFIQTVSDSNKKTIVNNIEVSGISNEISKTASTEEAINKANVLQDSGSSIRHATSAKTIIAKANNKGFYAGIVAGPEFNQVKSQGFKKAGFNIGLVAGYKLNNTISVEAGIVYKNKYYFSDGKYFNVNKNTSMPAGMKIISLNGSSNVLEIPVDIKYTVAHTKKSAVFAAAGISSYILLKENNNYNGSLNGVQEDLKRSYKNVSTGLFSSVDVSAGYEHTIGKQNTLRIRPYVQIPLKGMGVGKMQVMSTGINIALSRSFH